MVSLFDIVRQAQSGSAMSNMSRQFGLSPDQTQRAMEALLPAFTLAFQHSVQNPNTLAQLLDMMASGRYAPFFDMPGQFGQAQPSGHEILDKLFGSPEASRQIAAQASMLTGIGSQVLQQMLPALAPVVMGGLSRYSTLEGMSEFLRNWSDWLRMLAAMQPAQPSRAAPASGTPFGAWSDLMGAMMGQGTSRPAPRPDPQQAADPWSAFMQGFMKSVPPGASAPPPPAPPPSQPNPLEALSEMFQTGRDVQAQYLASLQAALGEFWRAQDAPRAAPSR
ncbi:MAG: hypothetical protein JWQ36_459 [Enterovirga sp.]|jgi:hypothetical protein|nr:hypothetical protein [Enterovirga sp.]